MVRVRVRIRVRIRVRVRVRVIGSGLAPLEFLRAHGLMERATHLCVQSSELL